jgi:hypothetical protein
MSGAIEQAKAHFSAFGVQRIEVPEWGTPEGGPLVIYYHPINLEQRQRLATIRERDGYISSLADALIMKARTAEDKPMFTIADKHALRLQVDPDVLAKVITRMMAAPSVEDAEKNSPGTPSSS